jgi:hypothetical protein
MRQAEASALPPLPPLRLRLRLRLRLCFVVVVVVVVVASRFVSPPTWSLRRSATLLLFLFLTSLFSA